MTQINLPTYEQQQAIKQDTTNILDTSLEIQKSIKDLQKGTEKPTTLLSVGDGGYSKGSSPKTILQVFTDTNATNYLMGHTLVYPKNGQSNPINPFTQTEIADIKINDHIYSPSVFKCRIYKDEIMTLVSRCTNGGSNYIYSFFIFKVRGYNDKGLPAYELLASKPNILSSSRAYVFSFFFRKGDKIALLYGDRYDSYRLYLSDMKMLQFDLATKQLTTGSVSLSGVTGLNTSSSFYLPIPNVGTLNDIDYGYLMYSGGSDSSYGYIKYKAEYMPETNSIEFTGKWENYNTPTESYWRPYDPSPYIVTSVKYDKSSETLTYTTLLNKQVQYTYGKYGDDANSDYYKIPTTYEGTGGVVKPALLDGVAYTCFELTDGLAFYKLNSTHDKYEYVGTLSTAMFPTGTDKNIIVYKYISYGLHHFGLVISRKYNNNDSKYNEILYADYTNELRELLGIGG